MENTRRAIYQGRALAAEGINEHARMIWKTALSTAYSMQDYAGMFVLSVNIGEACIRIAMQSNATSQALLQLQEANENLEYALQLVESCFIWNVVGKYRALYQGVQRAETLKRKVKKLLDKLQQIEVEQETTRKEKVVEVCTTCGVGDGDILLDENDGYCYCRKCYQEYYATVGKDASIETAEELLAVEAVGRLGEGKRNGQNAQLCRDDEKRDASADSGGSSATAEPVEVTCAHSEDKHAEKIGNENTEKAESERTRYERVELGSLADFLAGTLHVEDKVEQPKMQQNDIRNDTLVLVAAATAEEEECSGEPVTTTDDFLEVLHDASPATSGKGVLREEGTWLVDEDTADKAREKCEYSIAQLLELWKLSPCDCPESLLVSPVRDNGCTPTPARNKVNNSRKKMNSTKTMRSAASRKQHNADVAESSQSKAPAETDATLSVSPLPTMELCNTLRKALQEERQTNIGTSCDISRSIDALLFDSSGRGHVRLIESWQ